MPGFGEGGGGVCLCGAGTWGASGVRGLSFWGRDVFSLGRQCAETPAASPGLEAALPSRVSVPVPPRLPPNLPRGDPAPGTALPASAPRVPPVPPVLPLTGQAPVLQSSKKNLPFSFFPFFFCFFFFL